MTKEKRRRTKKIITDGMENLTTAKKKKVKASGVKRERTCALFICLFCAVASLLGK